METETIQNAVRKVEQAPADADVRTVRRMEIGQAIQQGDVYLHRVPDNHPRGKQVGMDSVQIALGSGNGARHMAEGAVRVFAGCRSTTRRHRSYVSSTFAKAVSLRR